MQRKAVAEEEGTVVLAVGGEAGQAYEISAWEYYFAAMPAFRAERWDEAIALMEEGLARAARATRRCSTTSRAPSRARGGRTRRSRTSGSR